MKIALLLTGQLRTYKLCRHLFKNAIIDKYDTDVFMSINANDSGMPISQLDISDAISFFNPIDSFVSYDYSDEFSKVLLLLDISTISTIVDPRAFKNMFNQFYIVDQAYKMLQAYIHTTGTSYDLIIRLRFDQYIWSASTSGVITKLIRQPNTSNILYNEEQIEIMKTVTKDLTIELDTDTPNQIHVFGYGLFHHYQYVNDQFFTHGQHLLSTVSKFYEEIPAIMNKCAVTVFPTKGCAPEHFLYLFLKNHDITIARSKIKGIFIRECY